ncbi:MAG: hypothetical protein AAF789_10235, partial [Bacteroidota bacterium]
TSQLSGLPEGVESNKLKKVFAQSLQLNFTTVTVKDTVESALVQLVSDQLPLTSVGTTNLLQEGENNLSINGEFDLLPYLNDPTTQMIVDVNLAKDLEELSVEVRFDLKVIY